MSTAFAHLFTPLQIRGKRLKNRIMSSGHDTSMPTDNLVNEQLIAYHRARAEGGKHEETTGDRDVATIRLELRAGFEISCAQAIGVGVADLSGNLLTEHHEAADLTEPPEQLTERLTALLSRPTTCTTRLALIRSSTASIDNTRHSTMPMPKCLR